jgi:2-polyprenyl-3-methyl-5-hydroxy-6-metoxy-1,4-benzoquinol methylase
MAEIHYSACPVCRSTEIKKVLDVNDHSITQEMFEVWQCNNCTVRFTQDVPDQQNISRYYKSENYISHSNTNKGILSRIYKTVRNHTLETKSNLIKKYTVKEGALLDLGAGIGAFLNTMRGKGWDVTGVEPDEGARSQALKYYNLKLSQTSEFTLLPENSFDAITLWHVLEHVHELHPYLDQLKKLLKPNGKLFIAVPNYTSTDASFYGSYWAAYDVPRHLYHFSLKSIQVLIEQHGLSLTTIKPMWYDSFYISLLSSKYKNGRLSWAGALYQGMRSNMKAMNNKALCSSVTYIISKN